jgi:hypothetical protein
MEMGQLLATCQLSLVQKPNKAEHLVQQPVNMASLLNHKTRQYRTSTQLRMNIDTLSLF